MCESWRCAYNCPHNGQKQGKRGRYQCTYDRCVNWQARIPWKEALYNQQLVCFEQHRRVDAHVSFNPKLYADQSKLVLQRVLPPGVTGILQLATRPFC